jgi:hypothetical protein
MKLPMYALGKTSMNECEKCVGDVSESIERQHASYLANKTLGLLNTGVRKRHGYVMHFPYFFYFFISPSCSYLFALYGMYTLFSKAREPQLAY